MGEFDGGIVEEARGQGNSESRVSRDTVHPSLTGNFIPSSSLSLSLSLFLASSFFSYFLRLLPLSFFLSVFFSSLQLLYPKVSALESVRESPAPVSPPPLPSSRFPPLIQFISALSLGWPSSCFRALHSTVKGKVCNEISSESEPRRSLCPEV